MGIEKMFEEGVEKRDAVDSIREEIRSRIDEAAKVAVNEKYKKDVKEEDEEEQEEEGEEEEQEEEEEEVSESDLNEAFDVTASRVGGRKGTDDFQINRMSDLKKLAKSRQYDYFMVTKKNGDEVEFSVDPQGNLVEM